MKKIDELLVVDVESTCWEGMPPTGQYSEIIEIGIGRINLRHPFVSVPPSSILIRPAFSFVSEFCTSLTTITQKMLDDKGVSFRVAYEMLTTQYRSRDQIWASWGDYDRRQVENVCHLHHIPNSPFGVRHINLKTLFSISRGFHGEVSVEDALETMMWEFKGTLHRGVDDTYNIMRLAKAILRSLGNIGQYAGGET